MACWRTKMCTLIRHTICKKIVKIQYFRNEYSSIIMYENTQKSNKIDGFTITCSHIGYVDIWKCACWLDIHFVKV